LVLVVLVLRIYLVRLGTFQGSRQSFRLLVVVGSATALSAFRVALELLVVVPVQAIVVSTWLGGQGLLVRVLLAVWEPLMGDSTVGEAGAHNLSVETLTLLAMLEMVARVFRRQLPVRVLGAVVAEVELTLVLGAVQARLLTVVEPEEMLRLVQQEQRTLVAVVAVLLVLVQTQALTEAREWSLSNTLLV
jgi:hypothetical protein